MSEVEGRFVAVACEASTTGGLNGGRSYSVNVPGKASFEVDIPELLPPPIINDGRLLVREGPEPRPW